MEIADCIIILGYSYHLASSEFPLESIYNIMQGKQDELHKIHYII